MEIHLGFIDVATITRCNEVKEMEPCQAKWRNHADSAAIGCPSALS